MSKKKVENKRAKAGSGEKHDKHAPKSEADIAAAEENAKETENDNE